VLTPCDACENFLPPMFRPLQLLAHAPLAFDAVLQLMRPRPLRFTPFAYGWLMRHPDADLVDGWVRAMLADRGVRRDATKLLRGVSNRQTLEAAERLRSFDRPVLIAWAAGTASSSSATRSGSRPRFLTPASSASRTR
jgi:hypothetical protein